jgi:3-methyladenine DNA glycosylase/8-oxoguanine DNA glycosylase
MNHDLRVLRRARAHLRRADPALARVVDSVGPCRMEVERGGTAFASLAEAMLYQQITGKAAATIHRRLCALFGRSHLRGEDILGASAAELRAAGLSRQKIRYLRDLSEKALDRDALPLHRLGRMADEDAIQVLTTVKGIGRWTAEIFLMFRLGRLDVLPVADYGIQKAMQRAYRMRGLPKPDRMRRIAERWRPYRTVACWYLWKSIDGAAGFE